MKDLSFEELTDILEYALSQEIILSSRSKSGKACKMITYTPSTKVFRVSHTKTEYSFSTENLKEACEAYIEIIL